jgi:hypothetical protein
MRLRESNSLLLLVALLVGAAPAAGAVPVAKPASSGIIVTGDLADEAHIALTNGLNLLKRVLNLRQGVDAVSHAIAVGTREATLEIELAGGQTRTISLRSGRLLVGREAAGRYERGGALEAAWRRLLSDAAELETPQVVVALRAFQPTGLSGDDLAALERISEVARGMEVSSAAAARARAANQRAARLGDSAQARVERGSGAITLGELQRLDAIGHRLEALDEIGADVAVAVRSSPMRLGDVTVAAGQRVDGNLVVYEGNADIHGEVTGHVVALFGDVTLHPGAVVGRNAVAVDGEVRDAGGSVRGDIKTITAEQLGEAGAAPGRDGARRTAAKLERVTTGAVNVVAVFAALAMLGFGTVFFARRHVEIIADTASHSFGRSLVVGLLGQLLVLPTFAMLIVGLVFTVVGILLLPFAAVAYMIAAVLAVVGGYLAVAHAVGETFTRRRMAHGAFVRAPNAYGYLFTGLVGLLGLWALAALTGWLGPVAVLFQIAASIVTWLAATVGFGAVLLSRGGLRETFSGRQFGESTDEYLWATPPATPTAARMGSRE